MNVKGHIRSKKLKNGKVSYQIIVETDIRKFDGKRNRFYKTVHTNKKQAEKELRNMIAEVENGTFIKPDTSTLRDFLNEWMNTYVIPKINKTTYEGYQNIINRNINPILGNIPIADLTPIMVQKWVNQISEKSPSKGIKLKPNSVKNSYLVLHSAMQRAVMLKIIKESPCENIELPKLEKYKAEVMEEDDINKFFNALKGTDFELALTISITLGLRRGKLLELRWSCIDWNSKIMNITENRVQTPESKTS